MTGWKLVTLLGTGLIVAVMAIAACGGGTTTPASGNAGTGSNSLGTFSTQDIESLARALGSGVLPQVLGGQQAGIWVNGQGKVSAIPDLALLNLGVEARADTVAEARGQAASALTAMVDVLKDAGLIDEDLQTRFFNIQPQYSSREVTRCIEEPVPPPATVVPEGMPIEDVLLTEEDLHDLIVERQTCFPIREQVIVGYVVNNQITAKIRDLEGAGEIIDRIAQAGGDLVRIQGISFTVEDTDALENQAREKAIQSLVAKAQQMATVAEVQLGDLVFLTESGGGVIRDFARAVPAVAFAEAAFTPISVGELDIMITVQGVFSIVQ